MMNVDVAYGYDAIALDYERLVAGDDWMRRHLWNHYLRCFRVGHHVLDVGCGTGIDARFLASHGIRVTAIDVSTQMVAQLVASLDDRPGEGCVHPLIMDVATLGVLPAGRFDGIISAFAGLNTVPDLRAFAYHAARLLRPDGRMIVHMLNRHSLWELLDALTRRHWSTVRRLYRQRARTFVIGGRPVPHTLFSPHEVYRRAFKPYFRLNAFYGIGILRPPHTLTRVPAPLVRLLERLERVVGSHPPFCNWGRFFVLELQTW